jgi:hypothetical protein
MYSEKTCPITALSPTNSTCCPEANPGRCDRKPATNRLSCGTALCLYNYYSQFYYLSFREVQGQIVPNTDAILHYLKSCWISGPHSGGYEEYV